MADLTLHTYRWCATNNQWSTTIVGESAIYQVSYGLTADPEARYSHAWTCTCPAFRYQGHWGGKPGERMCKHVREAQKVWCGYGRGAVYGEPEEMGETCPKCGGQTQIVRVAV